MKCSIGYSETKVMITYEDLQQEAKNAADRNFEYIEVLRKHVRHFIDLYWQSLNVPGAPTFQDWNGNEERIITLGNVENGKFVKKYLHEFQVNDKFELPVIVKTIIKTDAIQSPWVTVPLVVKEEGGKVQFVIGGSDDATTCNIPAGDDIQVYSEAAELMKSIIVKMIKRTAPQ